MIISDDKIEELKATANRVRVNAIKMAVNTKGRGAHIGSSLSCVEIVTALYCGVMNYCNSNHTDEARDRFICSKTHAVLATYPILHEIGLIAEEDLLNYRQDGSDLFGYPRNTNFGLEFEGGSLGMGLSFGIGQALAARLRNLTYRTFVLLGDGELNEGSVWEGFMAASQYKLANLTVIIDRNNMSLDGDTESIIALEPLQDKLVSFGWHVLRCNGHNFAELFHTFAKTSDEKPSVVIADTIKGKGVSFMENRREWHQARINEEQSKKALAELAEVRNGH